MFGMGLILVQVQKKLPHKNIVVCWRWGKFEQFQHQIPKGSLVVKVI